MARNAVRDPSIGQKHCTKCFDGRRGKGRKAKTRSNKVDRRLLKRDTQERSDE